MKTIINSSLLARLKPSNKQYDIWDTKLTGFILRVNPNGNMVYRCEYGRGKRVTIGNAKILTPMQARDRAKEILADAIKGIDPRKDKLKNQEELTFKKFIENEYTPWVIAHRKSGTETVARIKRCFFSDFDNKPLIQFTVLELEKWRTQKINQGCKKISVNRDIIALRAAITKAVEWGFIEKHPLLSLKLLKTDNSPKVRYLDYEEEKRLREGLDAREKELRDARSRANEWRKERGYELLPSLDNYAYVDYLKPMVLLSLNTGIRRGELFSLLWENIDLDNNLLTITGDVAKSEKTRHIPLNDEAKHVLKLWSVCRNNHPNLVFTNHAGQRLNNVKKSWANLMKASQIERFRWHDMRHHFASWLVMAGVDLNTVRELLGHSDIKMSLRYAHLAPEHKAAAVAKLVRV